MPTQDKKRYIFTCLWSTPAIYFANADLESAGWQFPMLIPFSCNIRLLSVLLISKTHDLYTISMILYFDYDAMRCTSVSREKTYFFQQVAKPSS